MAWLSQCRRCMEHANTWNLGILLTPPIGTAFGARRCSRSLRSRSATFYIVSPEVSIGLASAALCILVVGEVIPARPSNLDQDCCASINRPKATGVSSRLETFVT
ncbi:hypothetical protein PHLGIDRAFT_417501 [Phlebiopsis gigantea 11061_1 CR5-6]|uniref:Uncharacterized protein n=1 Tax=Phlebiopsis gigantea (strain 11061_1 CR5-6) TaxID=745531 RepID=A0A0C3PVG2_PHLG1|nr:hypothetical protein PHLGIDRAFT_417501 [Phlebiopsis gigantea 11061_1 CR5-6]